MAGAAAMILHAVEAGEGPAVLLLHGLFGSARNLGVVQRALAGRFRVIALDLRNHGASPHAADIGYEAQALDVLETARSLGAVPAAVIGHSMGGKAGMRLALDHPEAVSGLVVGDIAPVAYPPHFREFAAAMQRVPAGASRAEADAVLAPVVTDAAVRGFLLQNLVPGGGGPWRIGLEAIAAGLPVIGGWEVPEGAVYRGPVLFVAGERSSYIRREDRGAIRALFPAARVVTLRDAGHWLHADQPGAFVAVVGEFLARLGAVTRR